MLNGGGLSGREILLLPPLFRLFCQSEERPCFSLWLAGIVYRAAGYQQIRTCFDNLGNRVVSNTPVDLDPEIEP